MDALGGAEALQIVSTGDPGSDDANEFKLNEAHIDSILGKIPHGTKVAVLSIVGAFRTGKSFLLNLILRFLRHAKYGDLSEDWLQADGASLSEGCGNSLKGAEGEAAKSVDELHSFVWKGGQQRMTTGIWMWSEPFIKHCPHIGGEVAILLMDTQGMFDNETTMTLTAQIFGLSTMISSFQIYNVQNRIQEDNLQHLALFSEYGRLALDPHNAKSAELIKQVAKSTANVEAEEEANSEAHRDESATEKETDVDEVDEGDDESDEMTSLSLGKPFQRLQFLVRDSTEIEDFDVDATEEIQNAQYEVLRADMAKYFKGVIKDRGASDLQSTRDQIIRCFEHVNCFLLPHPGREVTMKSFSGKIDAIDPVFRAMINRYFRLLFEKDIEPKIINRRMITGPELLTYFKAYCQLFQDGKGAFPKAMTMLEATAEANNRNAYDMSFVGYKSEMNRVCGPDCQYVKDAELVTLNEKACQNAFETFDGIANMGSVASISKHRKRLEDDMEAERKRYFEANSLKNPFKDLEFYIVPIVIAAISWFASGVIGRVCSHKVCHMTNDALQRLYMFIIFVMLIVCYRSIIGSYAYLKELATVILQRQNVQGVATVLGKKDN